ncbi:MAG: glycosyltransferase family 2 protein [Achromobacter sp.]|uniref:glycosyltransferase family 2 protein n=1 Tax=Achromobacter sp. TaxID=134375 RepID=UPI003D0564BD
MELPPPRPTPAPDNTVECAIIVVAFNCWDHIYRCLDALQSQTLRTFKTIIVDNGDATDAQLERLNAYERLHYWKAPGNLGFAAGNNRGIELAGDVPWVIMLNPDTLAEPDWFATLMQAAHRHPEYAVFGSKLLQSENPALLDGLGDAYHISGYAWRQGIGEADDPLASEPFQTFSPCAAAALYRKQAIESIAGLDEDFFCYLEDVDLGFRLQLKGHRCLIIPMARVHHVGSAVTGIRSDFYIYHGQRNIIWAFVKNMPGVLFWLLIPFHFVLNLVGILRYALLGRLGVVLRAKRDALLGIPLMMKKRKSIQKSRAASLGDILRILDKRPVPGIKRIMKAIWK